MSSIPSQKAQLRRQNPTPPARFLAALSSNSTNYLHLSLPPIFIFSASLTPNPKSPFISSITSIRRRLEIQIQQPPRFLQPIHIPTFSMDVSSYGPAQTQDNRLRSGLYLNQDRGAAVVEEASSDSSSSIGVPDDSEEEEDSKGDDGDEVQSKFNSGGGGGDRTRVQDQKMEIEEQFAQMTVSGGIGPVGQKQDDGGFAVLSSPSIPTTIVTSPPSAAAAQLVKPISLELGGKSPIVVFDDVDIDKATEWTAFGIFWTNGQICSATSRLIIHENIAAEFLDRLVQWCKTIKIADPLEEGCRLGPVVSGGQYEKILMFIATAKSEGARVLSGGARPEHLKEGFFIEPTIITDVTTSMQIWREEVFGPVLCVKTFSSEDEALELANDTHYGFGAAVISKDLERCERVSKALQAGIVWINCSQPCFCQAPWGGNKRSGFGRELGKWGLDNYLTVKQVTEYVSDDPWGWYKSPSKL